MSLIEFSEVNCPYCGELIEIAVDSSINFQEYIEDCSVCCRPMNLGVHIDENGKYFVEVRNDTER